NQLSRVLRSLCQDPERQQHMDEGEVAPYEYSHAQREENTNHQHVGAQLCTLETNPCVPFVGLYFRCEFATARNSEQGVANDLNDNEHNNYANERRNFRGLDLRRRIRQGECEVDAKRGTETDQQEPKALFAERDAHD